MKRIFRQMCCFLLVASMLLQITPMAQAQPCKSPCAGFNAQLQEARGILCEDNGPKGMQSAKEPLDRAKRIVKDNPGDFSGQTGDIFTAIEKAKVELLWNNRNEALTIVNKLLGMNSCNGKQPIPQPLPQKDKDNKSGFGAVVGGTLLVGIITAVAGFFLGWGQVSHR